MNLSSFLSITRTSLRAFRAHSQVQMSLAIKRGTSKRNETKTQLRSRKVVAFGVSQFVPRRKSSARLRISFYLLSVPAIMCRPALGPLALFAKLTRTKRHSNGRNRYSPPLAAICKPRKWCRDQRHGHVLFFSSHFNVRRAKLQQIAYALASLRIMVHIILSIRETAIAISAHFPLGRYSVFNFTHTRKAGKKAYSYLNFPMHLNLHETKFRTTVRLINATRRDSRCFFGAGMPNRQIRIDENGEWKKEKKFPAAVIFSLAFVVLLFLRPFMCSSVKRNWMRPKGIGRMRKTERPEQRRKGTHLWLCSAYVANIWQNTLFVRL